jgi:CheY-like chemotaxis protein
MIDKQPSFLYVEDEIFSRQVLEMILTRIMGYSKLTLYEDSKDFMERLKELPEKPAIIFLDIMVQPLTGYEMLKLIRSDPELQECKVVAVTANIMPSDVTRLQQMGFDSLIGKPLVHKVFPELVRKILAGEQVWYIP